MTDKEKLKKIKKLADAMYTKMQNLITDTSGIRTAMEEYHQFIINEYNKEEPISEDLKKNQFIINEYNKEEPISEDLKKKSEYPFKKGDKVIIHCKAERHQDNVTFELFNNKVGTVQYVGELKTNPWGNIGVIIDDGYNDAFYVEELELIPKEKEAQKGETT